MNVVPQWTDRAEKRGLDPLGLQNSGIALYQNLLPGISNVTPRLRYFGYYAWVSDTYAKRVGKTDPETWRTWVRRSEALLALVSANAGGEGGVGGIEWATGVLANTPDVIDFVQASGLEGPGLYLRQRMGIFGGAYVSQLLETGLFALSEEHPIAIASTRSGRPLADAFRKSIGSSETILITAIETGSIRWSELDRLRTVAPSQIPTGSTEASLYLELLTPSSGDATQGDVNRRDTLRLVLAVGEQLSKAPNSDDVRWCLFDPAMSLPKDLEPHRLSWEAYHAHDLFQLAAAGLFSWALSYLGARQAGFTYAEISAQFEALLAESDAFDTAASWADVVGPSLADDGDLRLAATALGRAGTPADDRLALALKIITAIHRRINSRPDLAEEIERRFELAPSVRSIRSEIAWFNRSQDQPSASLLALYLVERVLKRHSDVALRKLRFQRDYTFHFEAREGRLVRRFDYLPVLTSPRLGSALQVLRDLDLMNDNGASPEGILTIDAHAAA